MTSRTVGGGARQAWAAGGMVFAAVMLLILGLWQVFLGIAAIARGEFFVVARNYVYTFNITTWGWIHLLLGAVAIIAGFGLFSGATWARAVGIVFAVLSAIGNFFFIPTIRSGRSSSSRWTSS